MYRGAILLKKYSLLLSIILLFTGCSYLNNEVEAEEDTEVSTFDMGIENNHLIIQDNVVVFPEPNGLTEVSIDTLGNDLPDSKDDGDLPVILKFSAGGATLNTYGEIKVQGSSTAKWPKKNWSLKFYADEERTERLRLKIGDSVESDKWIAKAEWVDPTILRNALSFRLWEAMVQSRKSFPQYEVDNAWVGQDNMTDGVQTGAQGFPKTHPIHVKVNDEHYGISMLLLGHDPRNFNIDKSNPNHIYMEFDLRGGESEKKGWEKFSSEGVGGWIDGYYPQNDDFNEEQLVAVDALGDLFNGSQSEFEENFENHLDKTNMIDMLLFLEAIYDYDAVAQDIEFVTYDLEKWYLLPWDKDTTFGADWNARGIRQESATELLIDYDSEHENQKPWFKTYQAFTPEVEARYAQLRNENIFSVNGLYQLTGDITKHIPKEVWEAERNRWEDEDRPSLDETSTSQIILWFEERLDVLDKQFNYIP